MATARVVPIMDRGFSNFRIPVKLARVVALALLMLLPIIAAQASELPQSCYIVGDACYIIGNTCFNEGANCGDGSTPESNYKWKAGWCEVAIYFGVISGTVDECVVGSARTLREQVLVSSLDPSISVVRVNVAAAPPQGSQEQGSNQQQQQSRSGNQQSNSGNGGSRQSGSQGNNQQGNQQNQQNGVVLTLTLNLPQQDRQEQNQDQQLGTYQQQQQGQYQQQQQQQQRTLAERRQSYQQDMNSLACGETLDLTGLDVQSCGDNAQGEYECETITSYTKRCSC